MKWITNDPADAEIERLRARIEALEAALKRIASETTPWDWDEKDGPNALVKILLQMRAEALAAIAPEQEK